MRVNIVLPMMTSTCFSFTGIPRPLIILLHDFSWGQIAVIVSQISSRHKSEYEKIEIAFIFAPIDHNLEQFSTQEPFIVFFIPNESKNRHEVFLVHYLRVDFGRCWSQQPHGYGQRRKAASIRCRPRTRLGHRPAKL